MRVEADKIASILGSVECVRERIGHRESKEMWVLCLMWYKSKDVLISQDGGEAVGRFTFIHLCSTCPAVLLVLFDVGS